MASLDPIFGRTDPLEENPTGSAEKAQPLSTPHTSLALTVDSMPTCLRRFSSAQSSGSAMAIRSARGVQSTALPRPSRSDSPSVDAPEKAQSYGARSKQNLSALCFRRSAEVRPVSLDRYGRTVAHVTCEGHDASAEQVREGMAWVFVRYAAKGSPLYGLERDARASRRGIWADAQPVAPWEWRRAAAS